MPSGMAAEMRAALQTWDRDGLVLERSDKSKTGFTNVIEVKGKFQARLQVPGDGRGGSKKRKQVPLPGLFDDAEDAAVYLASYKKGFRDRGLSAAEAADKIEAQDKKHKPRQPQQPAVPPTLPMFAVEPPVTVVGMPIPFVMHHAPFVAASPLPMEPMPAPSLHTTVWVILICVCYVIVYVRTEDNPILCLDLKITLANPTPLLAGPDRA